MALSTLEHPSLLPLGAEVESVTERLGAIHRSVTRHDGSVAERWVSSADEFDSAKPTLADVELAFLRGQQPPREPDSGEPVRVADLFSGCGGMTLGIREAARTLGYPLDVRLAVDSDVTASEVFARNFAPQVSSSDELQRMLPGEVGQPLDLVESDLRERVGPLDLLLGGPPCQGHSAFNNRTRHSDVRNTLYMRMVRAAEVFEPEHVVIENVPGALNDRAGIAVAALRALRDLGYTVSHAVVDAADLGVPQTRKRLLVVASASGGCDVATMVSRHLQPRRSVRWAIEDLEGADMNGLLDEPARSAPDTRRRIDYLFDHGLWELPNSERPACHSNGGHSYKSIYGRVKWDEPAQTITTGFYSMCMGRYVHPSRRRTLTAHEAARLQFIPDSFDFSAVQQRGQLATMIGNAVPSRMAYVIALELLR